MWNITDATDRMRWRICASLHERHVSTWRAAVVSFRSLVHVSSASRMVNGRARRAL